MKKTEISGLILVDKPEGMSSFSVISRLRCLTGMKKIGHSGTLDPFATGLLPVLFGRYTRLARYIENHDKYYQVVFTLGKATKTLDLTSDVIDEIEPAILEQRILSGELEKSLQNAVKSKFIGEIEQIPPMYSAVKFKGKPLYQYARAGEEIERKPRRVTIYDAKLSAIEKNADKWQAKASIHCQKGTYIRTWVFDLAKSVHCLAYSEALRRLQIGDLHIADNPVHLDELFEIFNSHDRNQGLMKKILAEKYFYPITKALKEFPVYRLNREELKAVAYGRKLVLDFAKISKLNKILVSSQNKVCAETGLVYPCIVQLTYQNHLTALADIDPTTLEFVGYKKVLISPDEVADLL